MGMAAHREICSEKGHGLDLTERKERGEVRAKEPDAVIWVAGREVRGDQEGVPDRTSLLDFLLNLHAPYLFRMKVEQKPCFKREGHFTVSSNILCEMLWEKHQWELDPFVNFVRIPTVRDTSATLFSASSI